MPSTNSKNCTERMKLSTDPKKKSTLVMSKNDTQKEVSWYPDTLEVGVFGNFPLVTFGSSKSDFTMNKQVSWVIAVCVVVRVCVCLWRWGAIFFLFAQLPTLPPLPTKWSASQHQYLDATQRWKESDKRELQLFNLSRLLLPQCSKIVDPVKLLCVSW